MFQPIWALIRPWLDPVTRSKFHVLGSGFASTLHEYIDPAQLPPELEGTCACRAPEPCIPPLIPCVAADFEGTIETGMRIKNKDTEADGAGAP